MSFGEVFYHRTKYFLSPQLDIYRNISAWIGRQGGSFPFSTIVDYGCGNGVGTIQLLSSTRTVIGVDSDSMAIKLASDLFGHLVTFYNSDWTKKAPVGQVSFISCIEVIEHVENPTPLIERFFNALLPCGVLMISTLNHNSEYRKNDAHVGKYKVETFRGLLRQFFSIEEMIITDYKLMRPLNRASTITPMIAICRKGK